MIDFFLKQLLALMEPLGFVWGCLILLGAALLWKGQRALAAFTFTLVAIIFVFGSTGVPGWLVQSLERPFAGTKISELPRADAIVVLGGGAEPARYEAAGFHFTYAADRILMGLELARLEKAPVLVIGGAGAELDGEFRVEGDLIRAWVSERKLAPGEVLSLGRCKDTHDEALRVRTLARQRGWKRVLLVTSANHLRRAVATFRSAGVEVVPVPCNFLTEVSLASAPRGIGVPRAGGFVKASIWLHEQIGWFMYRKRGWIAAEHAQ